MASSRKLPRIPNINEVKHNNFVRSRIIDIIDSLNLGMIFFFFLTPELNQLLALKYRFFLFPLAAVMANVAFIWELKMALANADKNDSLDNGTLFWLGMRFIGAVAITAAVMAGFSAIPALAQVPSMMFMFTLSLGTLVNRDAFIYFWGQSNAPKLSDAQQNNAFGRAKTHALIMLGLVIADIAVTTTMFMGITACAPLGILGSAILVFTNVKGWVEKVREWNDQRRNNAANDTPFPDSTTSMLREVSSKSPRSPTPLFSPAPTPGQEEPVGESGLSSSGEIVSGVPPVDDSDDRNELLTSTNSQSGARSPSPGRA